MSKFKIQQEGYLSATSIPNCFIEKYMPKAAGEFVKIFIYLLKCVEENKDELSISRIADALEDSEKDVIRALKYWEKKGLLKLTFEDKTLTSLRLVSFAEMSGDDESIPVSSSSRQAPHASSIQPCEEPGEPEAAAGENGVPVRREYSPSEIEAFSKEEDMIQLLYAIQKYIGHSLSGSELNTVLFFYDTLKLPAEVIDYLFEYCVSKGHKSMRYIEKTAIGWSEQGIKSLKAAKTLNSIYSENTYPVLRAFGLTGRNPSSGEVEYVKKWSLSYRFSQKMILEACERTMNAIHQPSFEYADSILKRWKSEGVSSMEDVVKLDLKRENALAEAKNPAAGKKKGAAHNSDASSSSNKFNNFKQRAYDFDQLEEKLFNT